MGLPPSFRHSLPTDSRFNLRSPSSKNPFAPFSALSPSHTPSFLQEPARKPVEFNLTGTYSSSRTPFTQTYTGSLTSSPPVGSSRAPLNQTHPGSLASSSPVSSSRAPLNQTYTRSLTSSSPISSSLPPFSNLSLSETRRRPELDHTLHLANLWSSRDDGQDTFGNVGSLRYVPLFNPDTHLSELLLGSAKVLVPYPQRRLDPIRSRLNRHCSTFNGLFVVFTLFSVYTSFAGTG